MYTRLVSKFVINEYSDTKQRKITKNLSDESTVREIFNRADKLSIETFNIIIDKLTITIEKRSKAYFWSPMDLHVWFSFKTARDEIQSLEKIESVKKM